MVFLYQIVVDFSDIRCLKALYSTLIMGKTYKIVMVRHGESTWNQENRFCGWFDAGLSEKGLYTHIIDK